jgi:pimeloyl-ACP methyl ester carboxylesterase
MGKQSVRYKSVTVDGINIFYREAGSPGKQPIILLNGIPDASNAFEELMMELKGDYYLVAPDFPGLGSSDAPSRDNYEYTFENISGTIERFMKLIGLSHPSVYALGCGGTVAFRIAMRSPDAFRTFILQNANAYEEALGPLMAGETEVQRELFSDYVGNTSQYPRWQRWLRETQPKMLLVWGKNDVFFPTVAAEAFKGDVPGTKLYIYDAGYLALEEYHREIAGNIRFFLG